jgi:hypothetical protein
MIRENFMAGAARRVPYATNSSAGRAIVASFFQESGDFRPQFPLLIFNFKLSTFSFFPF